RDPVQLESPEARRLPQGTLGPRRPPRLPSADVRLGLRNQLRRDPPPPEAPLKSPACAAAARVPERDELDNSQRPPATGRNRAGRRPAPGARRGHAGRGTRQSTKTA